MYEAIYVHGGLLSCSLKQWLRLKPGVRPQRAACAALCIFINKAISTIFCSIFHLVTAFFRDFCAPEQVFDKISGLNSLLEL